MNEKNSENKKRKARTRKEQEHVGRNGRMGIAQTISIMRVTFLFLAKNNLLGTMVSPREKWVCAVVVVVVIIFKNNQMLKSPPIDKKITLIFIFWNL